MLETRQFITKYKAVNFTNTNDIKKNPTYTDKNKLHNLKYVGKTY